MKNSQNSEASNRKCIYLTLLFWLFFSYTFAQRRIEVGAKVMPEMSYTNRNSHIQPMLSLSGGLQGILYLNKNIGVETGLYYQDRGFQVKSSIRNNKGRFKLYKYNFYFLSFPLLLRGTLKSFYASIGLSYDIFVLQYQVRAGMIGFVENSDISRFNASALGNIGYERKLLPNFTTYIELRYNSTLLKYYTFTQSNNVRMYNYGIGIGIHYDIKR